MDLETARFLISRPGTRLLARARASRKEPAHRRVDALREGAAAQHVRAALVQDDLRRRAAARCPHAERLLFHREALEQATAWPVAVDRATRWPGPADAPLTDLTAGIGFDTLATAWSGRPVLAFERDPVRALLLAHNADALGLSGRVQVRREDVLTARPSGPLGLLDPDRRPGGRRTRDPESFAPPASTWAELLERFEAAMVKLPPSGACPAPFSGPQEVVSLGGRARERRLHLGAFGDLPLLGARRLPDGAGVAGTGRPWPEARPPREGDWLLDPDAAVTLAGLVGDLAEQQGLRPIHPRIAYLLGSATRPGLPGHGMVVEAILPPRPSVLDGWLEDRGVGRLTLRSRGVADRMADWRRRLHPRGEAAGTLVFTRDPTDRWVVLAGRPEPCDPGVTDPTDPPGP